MSIGNLKDSGNKGNNFPFQLKVLNGISNINTNTNPNIRNTYFKRITNTVANIADKVYSIAFQNAGTANALINSTILKPGEGINFDAGGSNNYFPIGSFTINTSIVGSEVIVTYIF